MSSLKKHLVISHPKEYTEKVVTKLSNIYLLIKIVHLSDCKEWVSINPEDIVDNKNEEEDVEM
jgi:Trm5-related predicted tRNA methylase